MAPTLNTPLSKSHDVYEPTFSNLQLQLERTSLASAAIKQIAVINSNNYVDKPVCAWGGGGYLFFLGYLESAVLHSILIRILSYISKQAYILN